MERNLTNVVSVAELLPNCHALLDIKPSILERNLTNVMNVAKLIPNLQALLGIKKGILKTDINPTHVAVLLFRT